MNSTFLFGTTVSPRAVMLPASALDAWHRDYPYEVRAVTDDAPFFWHFVRFRDLLGHRGSSPVRNVEEGIGERLLVVLLGGATLLAALFTARSPAGAARALPRDFHAPRAPHGCRLTPHARAFVAWCRAVNGFCSVVASVLVTILSMSIGFDRVLLAGGAIYLVGIAALRRVPSPPAAMEASAECVCRTA